MEQNYASKHYRLADSEMLREACYGKFEGDPNGEMLDAFIEELGMTTEAFMADPYMWLKSADAAKRLDTSGMAEDAATIKSRMQTKLLEVAKAQAKRGGNVLVVAHGMSINIMLSDLDPDFNYTGTPLANAAVCKVVYQNGKFTIESFNDTSYIDAGKELRGKKDASDSAVTVYLDAGKEPTGKKDVSDGAVTVYLLRHGQTIFNRNARAQGWGDTPLTEAGEEVAVNVGKGLSNVPFALVYSSDSGRSIATANIMIEENKASSKKPVLDQRKGLREFYFGGYEGELDEVMWGDVARALGFNNMNDMMVAPPDMKTLVDTLAKVDQTKTSEDYNRWRDRALTEFKAICEEAAKTGGGNIMIVSHGMTAAMILNELDPALNVPRLANASVNIINFRDGAYEIVTVNDTSYNEKGKALRAKE
jgi:probable phosphoglycerate mutase